jgi:hypothetical protein
MTVWGHDVVDILINLVPMFLLIGAWIYFCTPMRGRGFLGSYRKENLVLNRRRYDALERVAAALEKKS